MFWKLISALIIIWIIQFIIKKVLKVCRICELVSKIPGPATTFPYGNLKPFLSVPYQKYDAVFRALYRSQDQEAPLLCCWLSAIPIVFITKAEAAEVLLKNSVEITKSDVYSLLKPWLGNGLLTSTGKNWHSRRKLLTPSFHFQILNNFVPIFNEKSKILVKNLRDRQLQGGTHFDIFPFITSCTLDIICETAMGINLNAQNQSNSDYAKALNRFEEIFSELVLRPWTQLPLINNLFKKQREMRNCIKIMQNFTKNVITKRKNERKSLTENLASDRDEFGMKKRKAFLDTLLDAIDQGQGQLTDKELREEVDTFMFEGHDTTACGIAWTIFYLGTNPDVQRKVQEELNQVLGDTNYDITMQDVSKLKYLDAESMRLMPPVPIYGRQLKNDIDIDGCIVPGGITIGVLAYYIHRDPKLYPEPEKFIPERHLDEPTEKHPFSFLSFSAGPRNCIGQKFAMIEEKIVLANIFRNFEIESRDKIDDIDVSFVFISRPITGIYVNLKKQNF